jgi:hypothetical protein
MGQISGIAFILAMDSFKLPATGSMTPSLVALLVLMGLAFLAATRQFAAAVPGPWPPAAGAGHCHTTCPFFQVFTGLAPLLSCRACLRE